MVQKVVLVVGVSGVGKSTLCQSISEATLETLHLTASNFVKTVGGRIDSDQMSLTRAIKSSLDEFLGSLVLIDGHLTFENFEIPITAIELLQLDFILALKEDPEIILERRKSDSTRVRRIETIDMIRKAQEREILYSQSIANALGIEMYIIQNPTVSKVLSKLNF